MSSSQSGSAQWGSSQGSQDSGKSSVVYSSQSGKSNDRQDSGKTNDRVS